MARRSRQFSNDFSLGELDRQFWRRGDTEPLDVGAAEMTNVVLRAGGGFARRPGSEARVYAAATDSRLFYYRGVDGPAIFVFRNGAVDVYADQASAVVSSLQTLSSAPWTTAMLPDLVFESSRQYSRDRVYVYHPEMPVQELVRAADGTWSRAAFAFAPLPSAGIAQPYFRFAAPDVTLAPSGAIGTVNIVFSHDFLEAGHVGARLRYLLSAELEVVTVVDAQNGTAIWRQSPNQTVTLTVTAAESAGFAVGEVIIGDTSERRGIIGAKTSTSLTVTMLNSRQGFEVLDAAIEKIVGPRGSAKPSDQVSVVTPASTSIWDEQLISPVRGYPATGAIHRGRHFLGGFPQAPSLIAASAVGDYTNYDVGIDVGEGAADAIVELLGNDPNVSVRHFVSAEQLIVLTDSAVYYVPEGGENPITPTSIAFLEVGPEGASKVAPALTTEGVLFIHSDTQRLMLVAPTGNVRRSWSVLDLSEQASHMLTAPTRLASANGLDGAPERYIMVLQADGSIAVAMARRGADRIGFVRWLHGRGVWNDLVADGDRVFASVAQQDVAILSRFSTSRIIDDADSYTANNPNRSDMNSDAAQNGAVIASGVVSVSGAIPGTGPGAGRIIGSDFAVKVKPLPPFLGRAGVKLMKISRYWLEVLDSGSLRVSGTQFSPALTGAMLDGPGAVRSRLCEGITMQFSTEPMLEIEQRLGEGAALDVRSLTFEVAY